MTVVAVSNLESNKYLLIFIGLSMRQTVPKGLMFASIESLTSRISRRKKQSGDRIGDFYVGCIRMLERVVICRQFCGLLEFRVRPKHILCKCEYLVL